MNDTRGRIFLSSRGPRLQFSLLAMILCLVVSPTRDVRAQERSSKVDVEGIDQRGTCPADFMAELLAAVADPPEACLGTSQARWPLTWTADVWEGRMRIEVAGAKDQDRCEAAVERTVPLPYRPECLVQLNATYVTPGGAASKSRVRIREIAANRSNLKFAEAICPGHARIDRSEKKPAMICTQCPAQADSRDPDLRIARAVQIGKDWAVLSTLGCGGGFNFRDSTVLLRRRGSGWKVASYQTSTNTEHCKWLPMGPPTAVCRHATIGQGSAEVSYYAVGLKGGELKWKELLSFQDNSGTCQFRGEFAVEVDKQLYEDLDGDGDPELALLVSRKHIEPGAASKRDDDPCNDLETGEVEARITREAHVFERNGASFRRVEPKRYRTEDPSLRAYFQK